MERFVGQPGSDFAKSQDAKLFAFQVAADRLASNPEISRPGGLVTAIKLAGAGDDKAKRMP